MAQDLDRAGIGNHQLPHCTLLVGLVGGVRPGDPLALSGLTLTLLLLVVRLVASYLPALRSGLAPILSWHCDTNSWPTPDPLVYSSPSGIPQSVPILLSCLPSRLPALHS